MFIKSKICAGWFIGCLYGLLFSLSASAQGTYYKSATVVCTTTPTIHLTAQDALKISIFLTDSGIPDTKTTATAVVQTPNDASGPSSDLHSVIIGKLKLEPKENPFRIEGTFIAKSSDVELSIWIGGGKDGVSIVHFWTSDGPKKMLEARADCQVIEYDSAGAHN